MLKIRTLAIGLILLITANQKLIAQDTDNELWTSIELAYKLNKTFDLEFREMLRLSDNLGEIDQFYSQLGLGIDLSKSFEIMPAYRFTRDHDYKGKIQGYESVGRFQIDLRYKQKINRVNLTYRFRYQNKNYLTEDKQSEDALRFKLRTRYNIRNWKLDPILSYEYFSEINKDVESNNRYRITLSTSYKLKKSSRLIFAYSYEQDLGNPISSAVNSFRIKYAFDLN